MNSARSREPSVVKNSVRSREPSVVENSARRLLVELLVTGHKPISVKKRSVEPSVELKLLVGLHVIAHKHSVEQQLPQDITTRLLVGPEDMLMGHVDGLIGGTTVGPTTTAVQCVGTTGSLSMVHHHTVTTACVVECTKRRACRFQVASSTVKESSVSDSPPAPTCPDTAWAVSSVISVSG